MYLVKEVILWGIWLSLSRKHFGELPSTSTVGGMGSMPGQGTHMPGTCGPKKKEERKNFRP